MCFFFIAQYSSCVFLYQSSKNKNLKHGKNYSGKSNIQKRNISGITVQTDTAHIKTGYAPHKTRQKQQGIFLNFHTCLLYQVI